MDVRLVVAVHGFGAFVNHDKGREVGKCVSKFLSASRTMLRAFRTL